MGSEFSDNGQKESVLWACPEGLLGGHRDVQRAWLESGMLLADRPKAGLVF